MTQKPLFWHQGLFLQPQHLQYTDLYHQAAVPQLHRITAPYFRGVVRVSVNEGGLSSDLFEVTEGAFLLPDGTLVRYPEDAALAPRSFASAWTDRNHPFTVYIGLRRLSPQGGNVTVGGEGRGADGVQTRFLTEDSARELPDLHQEGPAAAVKSLTYVLKLFWENEVEAVRPDYDLLPIAQIIRDGETIKFADDYIPPCLHLSSSPVLMKIIMGIRDELAGRTRQLEEYKTPLGVAGVEIDARSIPYRLALQMLCHYAPVLFHHTETPESHPWQIYGILRQMVGGFSILSQEINFMGETAAGAALLPPYDHNDIGACFARVRTLILRLLNEITVGAELLIPMEKTDTGMFSADIPDELFTPQSRFYLAMRTETPFENLLKPFLEYAKLGSANQVRIFAEHALPGLPVQHLLAQPEGVPRRPNATYFRLDKRSPVWGEVRREKNLVLLWPDAPEDLKPEIIVLRS